MSSSHPRLPNCGYSSCKEYAPLRCSRCLDINYCGAEHQGLHWPFHKKLCKAPETNKIKTPAQTQHVNVTSPVTSPVISPTDDNDEADDNICVICCDKRINAKFIPCGHSATCSTCADLLIARGEPCCFCRKPLNKYDVGKWEGVTGDVGLWPKSEENLRELARGEGFNDYFREGFDGNQEAYLR